MAIKGPQPIRCYVCGNVEIGPSGSAKTCYKCLAKGVKRCGTCKTVKPLRAFSYSNSASDGYSCRCKECKNQVNRRTYQRYYDRDRVTGYYTAKMHARRAVSAGSFTEEQWQRCCSYFNHECAYCGATERLTVEHIIPVSKFGASKIYNIIPACLACNCSKCDHDILEWYPKQPFYTEERLLKIHSWFKDMQKEVV